MSGVNVIAIVGIFGRFPGANDINSFWSLISEGKEGVTIFSKDDIFCGDIQKHITDNPDYVPAKGIIEGVEVFDTNFFEMTPSEAERTDPQHRIFLQTCYEALEDAGYCCDDYPGLIGVYGGAAGNSYLQNNVLPNIDQSSTAARFEVLVGNDKDYLATRVSYKLNLKGPAFTVQTACSSSLVAIHTACQALLAGECDMAIAGGVAIQVPQIGGYTYEEGSILSVDGHVRTFDAEASGVVFSNGVGVVVLKRLEDALADHDTIHAVLRGTAINNDGADKISFAAPSRVGQATVVAEAHAVAGIDPETISYVEAHGTATRLGDPIEIGALTQAFRLGTRKKQFCAIGSVKANIGHLDAAAGVTGLIKICLMMKHRMLVPSINFNQPNPAIDFPQSPFYVSEALKPWVANGPLRAGVSSFGIGGTNAHAIVEEAPQISVVSSAAVPREEHLLVLSAKTETALRAAAARLATHLQRFPDINLADVAFTLARGRRNFAYRLAIRCESVQRAIAALEEAALSGSRVLSHSPAIGKLVFDFDARLDDFEQAVTRAGQFDSRFYEEIDRITRFGIPANTPARAAFVYQAAICALWKLYGIKPDHVSGMGAGALAAFYGLGEITLEAAAEALADDKVGELARLVVEHSGQGTHVRLANLDVLEGVECAWRSGVTIDWKHFFSSETCHRISLPTYAFEGRRCWLPAKTIVFADPGTQTTSVGAADQSGKTVNSVPDIAAQAVWTSITLQIGQDRLIADHMLDAAPIAPAASMMDWALRAGRQITQRRCDRIENLSFEQILPFAGGNQEILVSMQENAKGLQFQIADVQNSASVAMGALVAEHPATVPEPLDLVTVERACGVTLSAQGCYALLASTGLDYGDSLRSVRGLFCNGHEALIQLKLTSSAIETIADYELHPALIDGALQGAAAFLAHQAEKSRADYLPFAVQELAVYAPLPAECLCHVQIVSGRSGDPLVTLNLTLVDVDGRVLAQLRSFSFKARSSRPQAAALGLFRPVWQEIGIARSQKVDADDSSRVLLFCGSQAEAKSHMALFGANRITCVVPGKSFRSQKSDVIAIDRHRLADYEQLLALLQGRDQLTGRIVILWSFLGTTSGTGSVVGELAIQPLALLSKAIVQGHFQDRVELVYAHPLDDVGPRPEHGAVSAFALSLRFEMPDLRIHVVGLDTVQKPLLPPVLAAVDSGIIQVRLEAGNILQLTHQPLIEHAQTTWRPTGVQLVTGGAGGVGLTIARYLADRAAEKIVLVGRSDEKRVSKRLKALKISPDNLVYRQCDVADPAAVKTLVQWIGDNHGPIGGVFHLAGTTRDRYFLGKTPEEMEEVLAPKIRGAINLDQATADQPLDRFVLFSSIMGVCGSQGQSDYAFANAYMDLYAARRQQKVSAGLAKGQTISIAWPFWLEGGMEQGEDSADRLYQLSGLVDMPTPQGLHALTEALEYEGPIVVAYGDLRRFSALTHGAGGYLSMPQIQPQAVEAAPAVDNDAAKLKQAEDLLIKLMVDVTRLDPAEITFDASLDNYAIDSLVISKLNRQLEKHFDNLSKTLFFEYRTLGDIAAYLSGLKRLDAAVSPPQPAAIAPVAVLSEPVERHQPSIQNDHRSGDPVAIIGLAGRYPKANTLQEFWANVSGGLDCIEEIPQDRWRQERYFDKNPGASGKAYAKWGGFLDKVDRFDPLFFGISPRQAELMDPQERQFLQTAWHTFEDAGYRRADVAQQPVGVFVGVMYGEYQLYSAVLDGETPVANSSYASIANRVSYIMDLTGPSFAVDTMCSSSLTAIHLACQSLANGECDMALAGGVNLSVHPYKYVFLSQGRYLSVDGRCRSFGADGTGYVPGEGVGAVLLKPLSKALADGDYIHGIIRGHAINHSGKTYGFTVPSPKAQAEVIGKALAQSGLRPDQIDYIETHGTGTSLGDPIEIKALETVFAPQDQKSDHVIPIGSVKSIVGHLESAAGMVGLSKVLLQFAHRQLAPSLHSEAENPNIDFTRLPFKLQKQLEHWQPNRPAHRKDEPLRAALSSFGAGGTNAHLVLEAFDGNRVADRPAAQQIAERQLAFVLSARDERALRKLAGNLAQLLTTRAVLLTDLAYSLQTGRETFDCRLAVMTDNGVTLFERLNAFAQGHDNGSLLRKADQLDETEKGIHAAVRQWLEKGSANWASLYEDLPSAQRPKRTPGPLYPFAEDRYWVPLPALPEERSRLHPLLDANESTLTAVRFRRCLRSDEPLIADHSIEGRLLLPGTGTLEMARAGAEKAGCDALSSVNNVLWLQPLVVEAGRERDAFLALHQEAEDTLFELQTGEGEEKIVHARGRIGAPHAAGRGSEARVDLAALRARLPRCRTATEIAQAYHDAGFLYGPSFDVIRQAWSGDDEALLELEYASVQDGVLLPPELLDGILRASHWVGTFDRPPSGRFGVPLSLGEIVPRGPIHGLCYAHATRRVDDPNSFDISIVDPQGLELAAIRRLTTRIFDQAANLTPQSAVFVQDWVAQAMPETATGADVLILFDDTSDRAATFRAPGTWRRVITVTPSSGFVASFADLVGLDPSDPTHYERLIASLGLGAADTVDMAMLWSLTEEDRISQDRELKLERNLHALRALLEALSRQAANTKIRCLTAHTQDDQAVRPELEAMAGFAMSIGSSLPKLDLFTLCLNTTSPADVAAIVAAELTHRSGQATKEIRHTPQGRQVRQLVRALPGQGTDALKMGGIYLISGAGGGVGLELCRYLAKRYQARLGLMGRSPISRTVLDELRALGAEVLAVQADVTRQSEADAAVAAVERHFGSLNGVFHLAGVAEPFGTGLSSREEFDRMLAPKLSGLIALDLATRNKSLDVFVAFSSIASLIGDFGNCSYAVANRFLDGYVRQRAQKARLGQRSGRSLSVIWPLWTVTGANTHVSERDVSVYRLRTGLERLSPEHAFNALEEVWRYDNPVLLPTGASTGAEITAVERALGAKSVTFAPKPPVQLEVRVTEVPAEEADLLAYLRDMAGRVLKMPAQEIDVQQALVNYGLDSVLIMETIALLGKDFPRLRSTALFEFPDIAALATHLLHEHAEDVKQCLRKIAPPENVIAPAEAASADPSVKSMPAALPSVSIRGKQEDHLQVGSRDIAIIGMSGTYPDAENLSSFWKNLVEGRNSVREVPASRWDIEAVYSSERDKPGTSYGRWGGFLDHADCFDSLFFQISPAQAKLMDPQERLFLQAGWAALEDAGYPLSRLPKPRFGAGGRDVGVFVGAMWDDYAFLAADHAALGQHFTVLANRSGIANQLSYFGDFRGPSMVIDTACSASLVALHQACDSLIKGECAYAIAGGVNVSAHALRYIHLSRKTMLSDEGLCRSFGAGGNGYVPGEGVGAVLLKPLQQALDDGDNIRAIIRATAVNHGGKAPGYTVPNPAAQQAVIEEALERANINAASIGYVEAHGTGTSLGDPIEHTGLTLAFARHTKETGFCALGSVKSNIGHLEGAAGISGVTKAVLQLQHGVIVPSLHAETVNPLIDFANSPFVLARECAPWPRKADQPRRAAVSSFGAGGTNAHVILEEFRPQPARDLLASDGNSPVLIVLSAHNRERLAAYAAAMARFLTGEGADIAPADIAFTLQIGREAMAERLAFKAQTTAQIARHFASMAENTATADWLYRGSVARELAGSAQSAPVAGFTPGDLDGLARAWVSGTRVDWEALYNGGSRELGRQGRIRSLPTYPFEKVKHWLPPLAARTEPVGVERPKNQYSLALPYDASLLRDHVIGAKRILPGAAHLVLAARSLGLPAALKDVVFRSPVIAGPRGIDVTLHAQPDGQYLISETSQDRAAAPFSQGHCSPLATQGVEHLNLASLRQRCLKPVAVTSLYERLATQGLHYGPSLRGVQQAWRSESEVLARLVISGVSDDDLSLQASVLDAAFHGMAELNAGLSNQNPAMPFLIDSMRLLGPIPAIGWSLVTMKAADRFDVIIADDDGRIIVDIAGLTLRAARQKEALPIYSPHWAPSLLSDGEQETSAAGGLLVLGGMEEDDVMGAILRHHADVPHAIFRPAANGLIAGDLQPILARLPHLDTLYVCALHQSEWAPASLEALRLQQNRLVLSFLSLVQGLDRAGVLAGRFQVKIITSGLFPLGEHEPQEPWSGGLAGVCAVLAKEYPQLKIALIDVRAGEWKAHMPQILAEPFQSSLRPVSLRSGIRRLREFARVELPQGQSRFRRGGVYVLVGGLGAVGRHLSLYLARHYGARLAIIGRSPKSQREEAIREISTAGAQVLYLAADATDPQQLHAALTSIRSAFGTVHGVIHAAMTLVEKRIAVLETEDFSAGASAKVDALWNLLTGLRDEPLDFFLLCSSGSSFDGNVGQAGYVAGCSFADAFARFAKTFVSFPVQTINWGYWAGEETERTHLLDRLQAAGVKAIEPEDGLVAIEQVLGAGLPQVLVSAVKPELLESIGVNTTRHERATANSVPNVFAALSQACATENGDRAAMSEHLAASADLDAALGHALLDLLQRKGVLVETGRWQRRSEIEVALGVIAPMMGYVRWMLDRLVEQGLLREDRANAAVALNQQSGWYDLDAIARRQPGLGHTVRLIQRVLAALPDVLCGQTKAVDLLFPGGSLEWLSPLYADDLVMARCNALTAVVLRRYVEEQRRLNPARPIRILEVGGGSGATTAPVLHALQSFGGNVDYVFTDVSAHFLRQARKRFGTDYPFCRYEVLDIEKDPALQGFEIGGFDLVIGSNVFHATQNIHATIGHCKALLAGNGVVLLNEGTRVLNYFAAIFGLTEGWTAYRDPQYRLNASPLLFQEMWRDVLADCGFAETHVWQPMATRSLTAHQSVIIARSNGIVPQGKDTQPMVTADVVSSPVMDAALTPAVASSDKEDRLAVRRVFARVLELPVEQIDETASFELYGIDSLVALELAKSLSEVFGPVPVGVVFDHTTIASLGDYLAARKAGSHAGIESQKKEKNEVVRPFNGVHAPQKAVFETRPASMPSNNVMASMTQGLSDEEVEHLLSLFTSLDMRD
jgi:polyketide synthase PksN